MKRWMKIVGIVAAALGLALTILVVVTVSISYKRIGRHWDVQPAAEVVPADEASAVEGGRLFRARGCAKCHGVDGSGVLILENPFLGTLWGANLTKGQGGVVANYKPGDWARSVRHGLKPDGYPIQVMDSKEYQYMSDRDLGLIVAYVQSLPPVDHTPPPLHITVLSHIWHGLGMLDVTTADAVDHKRDHSADPAPAASPQFGKHLLRLQCMGCHGEGLSGGKLDAAPGLPIPPNLTPDEATGLGKWTFEQFATVMRTGKRPDGRVLDKFMPWDTYAAMSDEELTAIWTFLRSQPPRPFGGR